MTNNSDNPCVSGNIPANYFNNGLGLDTGLDVVSGAEYLAQATGSWANVGGSSYSADGAPLKGIDDAGNTYILPTAHIDALLGRIGTSGAWFVVGSQLDFIAPQSGRLYLIANYIPSEQAFNAHWNGGLNFSVCLTNPTSTQPPTGSGNSGLQSVDIVYTKGSGPTTIQKGQDLTISSDQFGTYNGIDCTFSHPVQLLFESETNFPTNILDGTAFVEIFQPLGTNSFELKPPQYHKPSDSNSVYQVSRLQVIAPTDTAQFTVTVRISFIYTQDNNTDVTTTQPDRFITDELQNQIDELRNRLDNEDRFIQDGLTNGINSLVDSQNALNSTLSTGLIGSATGGDNQEVSALVSAVNSFGSVVDTFKQAIIQQNPILEPLAPQFLDPLLAQIKTLIDQILAELGSGIKSELELPDTPIGQVVLNSINTISDSLNKQAKTVDDLLHGKFNNLNEFYDTLRKSGANSGLLNGLQNAFTVFYLVADYLKARTTTSDIVLNQLTLANDTPNINDIGTIVTAYYRGYKTLQDTQNDLAKYGLNKDRITELLRTRLLLISLNDIKTAFQRGIINESFHDTLLGQYGIDADNIALIKSVYPLLPSPSDITRIADKHIFNNDIPAIFGQYDEIDQGYIESNGLWGISEDWTRKMWAAHWSLPGLQETFDMWHRGIIDDNQLNTYFALTDILPFFREKLKSLSHNLIGRVDIRRFYHLRIYSQQDVYNAYKKLGFSDEDANKQTQFTVENDRQSDLPKEVKIRTLTENMVVKAYKEGIITQQDAINRLGQVGYLPADAALILQLETQTAAINKISDKTQLYHDKALSLILKSYVDGVIGRDEAKQYLTEIGIPVPQADIELYYSEIERVVYLKNLIINHVKTAYTKGQVSKLDATNLMLANGIGASEIQLLFEELDITKELRNKELTLAQIHSLYNDGIISAQQLAQELINLGYNETHAEWLLQQIIGVQ